MTLTPEKVLAGFPDWAGAAVTELDGGLTNRTWLVEKDGRKAVLKIDDGIRSEPHRSRSAEAAIQSMAAEHGLANAVIHASERVLMTAYAEGVVWSADCLEDDENIEQLAQALRRLHSLPLTGRTFDAAAAARAYARRIVNPDSRIVAEKVRIVEQGPRPQNLCFCHNDLVVGNIINVPETRFLDWEYACDNDPLFDLASLIGFHDMDRGAAELLLGAYAGGATPEARERLERQTRTYDALQWLWFAVRETISPNAQQRRRLAAIKRRLL